MIDELCSFKPFGYDNKIQTKKFNKQYVGLLERAIFQYRQNGDKSLDKIKITSERIEVYELIKYINRKRIEKSITKENKEEAQSQIKAQNLKEMLKKIKKEKEDISFLKTEGNKNGALIQQQVLEKININQTKKKLNNIKKTTTNINYHTSNSPSTEPFNFSF